MLMKNLEVRRIYTNGFDSRSPEIKVEVYDLDREIGILEGYEITDRISYKLQGMILGLQMAGYSAQVVSEIEKDELTGKTRKLILDS